MRLFGRRDRELEEEIAAHLRMAEQDRMDRGESEANARRAVRREFGNEALVKEMTREVWGFGALRGLSRDFRLAARMLRHNPGYAATAVATLALGIGANTAIYSTMRVALTPLAVPAIDRVVTVFTENPKRGEEEYPVSLPDFRDWRSSGIFSGLAAFDSDGRNLRAGDRTERAEGLLATGDYFDVLRAKAAVGRLFGPEDAQPGHGNVVVLGNAWWRSHFAADPAVIGRTVFVDGAPFTVIGVLAPSVPHQQPAVFYPLVSAGSYDTDRGARHFSVIGRLRDGITFEAAQKRMDEVSKRLAAQYPDPDANQSARLQPLAENYIEDAKYVLVVLSGAVGFVLLIACANLANLALARATVRAREMTVRAALGASRWQLARQLLTESLLLSLLGGLIALAPAAGIIRLIASFPIEQLPDAGRISLSWSVLLFNLLLAAATGIIFGLAPVFQMRRLEASAALQSSSRSVAGGPHQRLRSLLVVSEVAFTLVLLAGAGLMLRTFWHVRNAYPGYDSDGVLTARVALSTAQYPSGEKQPAFFKQALQQAAALPGVRFAGAANDLPGSTDLHGTGLFISGKPDPRPGEAPIVLLNRVMGSYFESLRVPLLRGRYFTEEDRAGSPLVTIIDEWSARRYWPNQDPVGQFVRFGSKEAERRIVGVAGNVDPGLIGLILKGKTGQFYVPMAQDPRPQMALVIRASGDPMRLANAVRGIVRGLDVDEPVFDVMSMASVRARSSQMHELISILLCGFAGVALLLAVIGIYGVMAYNVSRRTREFGIRISLGARPSDVLRLAVRRGMALAFAGIGLGLAGAWGLTRLLSDLLYGVSTVDPATFIVVTVLLAAVTLLAGYLPARRATRVDPVLALREE